MKIVVDIKNRKGKIDGIEKEYTARIDTYDQGDYPFMYIWNDGRVIRSFTDKTTIDTTSEKKNCNYFQGSFKECERFIDEEMTDIANLLKKWDSHFKEEDEKQKYIWNSTRQLWVKLSAHEDENEF